jgi:hypothetical protein
MRPRPQPTHLTSGGHSDFIRGVQLHSEPEAHAIEMRPKLLVAVLATPPLTTSGSRTRKRVALAAATLGMDYSIANLVMIPTSSMVDLRYEASTSHIWALSRTVILQQVASADAVLLAYGSSSPKGEAGLMWREQIRWLLRVAIPSSTPCWRVGERATHPSRWQRVTTKLSPGGSVESVLRSVLVRHER